MLKLIGNRWSRGTHTLKDFMARNLVAYRWLDIESSKDARRALEAVGANASRLPVVILDDNQFLVAPSPVELAEAIGLRTQAENPFYDLIIVGGGPAGLAAAVYGASEGLRTLLIESKAPGGQAGSSSRIENYLGFPEGLTGEDLTRRAVAQAERFGVEIITPGVVTAIQDQGAYHRVQLERGATLWSHTVLIATGVSYRPLTAPGIDRLTGKGVYYGAALTEAPACRDEHVFLVGGANSAGQAALHFAQYARNVTMLVREPSLRVNMSEYLVQAIEETDNITVQPNTEVKAVEGENKLDAVVICNVESGEPHTEPATTMFIFIGGAPQTDWLDGLLARDEHGFILTGRDLLADDRRPDNWTEDRDPLPLETSVPGIFAAGDVRHGSVKRMASAVGEGAMAVQFIHQYLSQL